MAHGAVRREHISALAVNTLKVLKMSVHHLMTDSELVRVCPRCKRQIPAEWLSRFDVSNFHYKEFDCGCGYKVSVKVGYSGCGEDRWNDNLDKRIKEADVKSQSR
jgi:hypothetical protein